jgi:hypothetical protein
MFAPKPILDALRVRPFQPFHIELTNGEMLNISHPEQVWVAATEILVARPGNTGDDLLYDSFSIIGLDHVVQLHRKEAVSR